MRCDDGHLGGRRRIRRAARTGVDRGWRRRYHHHRGAGWNVDPADRGRQARQPEVALDGAFDPQRLLDEVRDAVAFAAQQRLDVGALAEHLESRTQHVAADDRRRTGLYQGGHLLPLPHPGAAPQRGRRADLRAVARHHHHGRVATQRARASRAHAQRLCGAGRAEPRGGLGARRRPERGHDAALPERVGRPDQPPVGAARGRRPGPAGLVKAAFVLGGLASAVGPTWVNLDEDALLRNVVETGRRTLGLRSPRNSRKEIE